jgi:hypothetical protein
MYEHTVNVTDEELIYINQYTSTDYGEFSKHEIFDSGLITEEQKIEFNLFSETFRDDEYVRFYNISIGKDYSDNDIIIFRNLSYAYSKSREEFYSKQSIVFPLKTIHTEEIIEAALIASNLEEISLDTLNWNSGGIVIHHFEKVEDQTVITFFLLEFNGNVSWFDLTI